MFTFVNYSCNSFRLTFYDTGDAGDFQTKVKEQLVQDYAEAQNDYNAAILEESSAKIDKNRRKHLRDNPKEVKSKADKTLVSKELSHYSEIFDAKRKARKEAKKEVDEAYKALESHKDEEIKGFVRENDIVKVGTQYKASWTHLPA